MGAELEIPMTNRYFRTADEDTGELMDFTHTAIGDIPDQRPLYRTFEGFIDRAGTGCEAADGKLPISRLRSGCPDWLRKHGLASSAAHTMSSIAKTPFNWFTDAELDQPVIHYSGYTPAAKSMRRLARITTVSVSVH